MEDIDTVQGLHNYFNYEKKKLLINEIKNFSYGGDPQNVCNFESGLNILAKPKSK